MYTHFPPFKAANILQIERLGADPVKVSLMKSVSVGADWLSYTSGTHGGKDSLLSPSDSSAHVSNDKCASVCV